VLTVLSGIVAFFVHTGHNAPTTTDDRTAGDQQPPEI